MSYPRNMAGAVALLASSSLLGLGCMVGADDPGEPADDQPIVAGAVGTPDTGAQGEASAGSAVGKDETEAAGEATGESKDPLWYGGYGRRFGGFGYPFYGGRFFGGYGYPFYGRRFYGGFGYPFPVYGGFGYPFYGYGGYGGCGYGFGC